MKQILKLTINITGFQKVENQNGCRQMILFDGIAEGPVFNGTILPGGVDTQKYSSDQSMSLSARYMLKGKDFNNNECSIFIENNASGKIGEELTTHPQLFTDSKNLAYLETANLFGKIENENGKTIIFIYENDESNQK